MIKPMDVTPEVALALQTLREASDHPAVGGMLRQAIKVLEETGVFAEIDEATDSESVPYILTDSAASALAEQHGARDHELHDPMGYLRAVNRARGR